MASSDGEAVTAPAGGGSGGPRLVCRRSPGGSPKRCEYSSPKRWCRERQLESVAFIGQGSDANVYLVRCKLTGRMSALKVQLKAEHEKNVERVHMERQVMVDARHPLVAPLYAAFQDRMYLYLEMEYCPGGSLDNFLRYFVKRNLTEDEARFYAAEISLGLEFLHSKGYVYRDLKAANVLVAASGHVKLTDFGISERGKLRIETNDRVRKKDISPPRPLPRVKSLPGFIVAVKDSPELSPSTSSSGSRPVSNKPAGGSASGVGVVGGPSSDGRGGGVAEARTGGHRRASSARVAITTNGSSSTTPSTPSSSSSSSPDSLSGDPHSSLESAVTAGAGGGGGSRYSSFFRRKKRRQQQDGPGATPPRPPSLSLGRRMRGRFLRSSRSSVSSSCSSSDSSSPSVSPHTAAAPGGGGGVPPPSPRCRGNEDLGSRSPPSPTSRGRAGMRRATVTLGEASWGLLSGSPEYMAPEVLMHEPQGSAVDWWGLGVLVYELLLGRTPFAGENGKTRLTFLNIMHGEARFPEPGERDEGDISGVCQEFVRALLVKDPRGRAGGASPVRDHAFFSGVRWDRLLEEEPPLRPPPGCCTGAGGGAEETAAAFVGVPAGENDSGWWWDDAIAVEDEEPAGWRGARVAGPGGTERDWSPFDRFNWSDSDRGARVGQ
ncbi:unnamed protein product [Ectocarpus sp. CCAP 1310/34]|nr:unnamed protein product [Ectocarpus sp. CCAP 1310/34]